MLDEALEKETSESLRNWLLLKKAKSLSNFTGEGEEFIPINSTCCDFIVSSMDRKEKYRTKLADDNAFDNNLAA